MRGGKAERNDKLEGINHAAVTVSAVPKLPALLDVSESMIHTLLTLSL